MQIQKYIPFLIVALLFYIKSYSQDVYQHISNKNIYEFIDELANQGTIEINSVVKPYTRSFIGKKLKEAKSMEENLNHRQQKELEFYLLEYQLEVDTILDYNRKFDLFGKNPNLAIAINPLGLFYKDKLFTLSVKPIWGIKYYMNENGTIFHRWGGGEAFAYIGKNWGLYTSLRDNTEEERISEPDFFTQRPGGAYKGYDYSEMRGGVTYSWRWGTIGLVKDHLTWGNNYHGATIITDRAPSFAQLKLNIKPVKWFELNYYHGWLVSMEVDSVRSYYSTTPPREVNRPKYIAANMFTFTPWKKLKFSIGNSIIYSDVNVHPAFFIPIMFYKSIDHTLNQGIDNQNSQMYLDISSRNIKKVHLYGTLFIDELKIERLSEPDEYNFFSAKIGAATSNLGIKNLSLKVEYSMSMPITYQHRVPTLTYQSNYYNMGFYLRDNSQDIYASLGYKPVRGLQLIAAFTLAQHGPDYEYDINNPNVKVDSHPFMEYVIWESRSYSLKATYEFINNAYLFAEYVNSDISGDEDKVELYTPEFFRGKTNTLSAGFNFGF